MKLQQLHESFPAMTPMEKAEWAVKNWFKKMKITTNGSGSAYIYDFHDNLVFHAFTDGTVTIKLIGCEQSAIPPFKIDACNSGITLFRSPVKNFDWAPAEIVGSLTLDTCKELTTFKGISRTIKKLYWLKVYSCPNLKSGWLEIAMLQFDGNVARLSWSTKKVTKEQHQVMSLLDEHLEKYGSGQKILELRKKFIEAGLESYL